MSHPHKHKQLSTRFWEFYERQQPKNCWMNEKRDLANEEKTSKDRKTLKSCCKVLGEKFPEEKARERINGISGNCRCGGELSQNA